MAKVRILVSVAGPLIDWRPDDVVEMPDDEALKWADGIRGELVEEKNEPVSPTPDPAPEAVVVTPAPAHGGGKPHRPQAQ